jgi:hypothetical protein
MSELLAGLLGGVVGGFVGLLGATVTSYWGPRMLEQWRASNVEKQQHGPRKELLRKMLSDPRFEIRTIQTLSRVSGTSDEECRRLLIELGARGVLIAGDREGWALIERYPLDREPDVQEP